MQPPKRYDISENTRITYAGVYLLEHMVNTRKELPLLLEGSDEHLEPIVTWLFGRDYVEIVDDAHYCVTDKGREVLKRFFGRFSDYLKTIDIYSAVDLQEGTFAFERIFDFDDEALWLDYLNQEVWDDLRVAVVELKGLDPTETVFMSFLNEGRFDASDRPWQAQLTSPARWNEITQICETALHMDDLGYEDDQGTVSGKEVLLEVVRRGAELTLQLRQTEEDLEGDDEPQPDDRDQGDAEEHHEVVVVEQYPVAYYEPYLDPFYVAPIWGALWLL